MHTRAVASAEATVNGRSRLSSSGTRTYWLALSYGGIVLIAIAGAIYFAVGAGEMAILPFLFLYALLQGARAVIVHWRYSSPVFLVPSGIEADERRIPWSDVERIRLSGSPLRRGRCAVSHGDNSKECLIFLTSDPSAVASSLLTQWQEAVGRDAVELDRTLWRGYLLRKRE